MSLIVRVQAHQRGLVERFGRQHRVLGPGWHLVLPLAEKVHRYDLNDVVPGWQGMLPQQIDARVKELDCMYPSGRPPAPGSAIFEPLNKGPATFTSPQDARKAALVDWLLAQASEQAGMDLRNDELARTRIAEAARRAMSELDKAKQFDIHLPFIAADANGPKHFTLTLKRDQLQQILQDAKPES